MPNSNRTPDAEERDVMEALGDTPFRCPPFDVLMALDQDVLPAAIAEAARAHLKHCRLCTLLLADMSGLPAQEMTAVQQTRVRAAVLRRSSGVQPRSPSMRFLLAVAALLLLATPLSFVVYRSYSARHPADRTAQMPPVITLQPRDAAAMELAFTPLEPPSGRIGLMTRGVSKDGNPTLQELLPAFRAYNEHNYDLADARLSALSRTYSDSQLVALYLGVSQLALNRNIEAAETLRRASTMSNPYDEDAVLWYSAVAASRLHQSLDRASLEALCTKRDSKYSAQSCKALQ